MIRFNYLAKPQRSFRPRFGAVAIDDRVRGPLAALSAIIVLTSSLGLAQFTRLRAAENAYTRASIRLTADAPAVRAVETLRADVLRATRLDDGLGALRRTNLAHANELTWIGNRLPAHTWLRSLRYDSGGFWLEGTSERAAEVGAALLALVDAGHATIPQLVSLHDDPGGGSNRVSYSLRLATRR